MVANSEQDSSDTEHIEHQTPPEKRRTPPETNDYEQPHETPKKRYELMKDPVFLSLPIYPPILHSKHSLSANRDDYLVSSLAHDRFIFKSLRFHIQTHVFVLAPTDYTFELYDRIKTFLNLHCI